MTLTPSRPIELDILDRDGGRDGHGSMDIRLYPAGGSFPPNIRRPRWLAMDITFQFHDESEPTAFTINIGGEARANEILLALTKARDELGRKAET